MRCCIYCCKYARSSVYSPLSGYSDLWREVRLLCAGDTLRCSARESSDRTDLSGTSAVSSSSVIRGSEITKRAASPYLGIAFYEKTIISSTRSNGMDATLDFFSDEFKTYSISRALSSQNVLFSAISSWSVARLSSGCFWVKNYPRFSTENWSGTYTRSRSVEERNMFIITRHNTC